MALPMSNGLVVPPTSKAKVVDVSRSEVYNLREEDEQFLPEGLRPYIDDESYRRAMLNLRGYVDKWRSEHYVSVFLSAFRACFWLYDLYSDGSYCSCSVSTAKKNQERARESYVQGILKVLEPLHQNGLRTKYVDVHDNYDPPQDFTVRFYLPECPGVATPENSLAQLALDMYTREKSESPNHIRLYLLHRSTVEYLAARRLPIPVFQELRRQGLLHCRSVDRYQALKGALNDVLALSYTWEGDGDPDSSGDRLHALAAHLREHTDVDFVWMDYPCLPQNTKVYARDVFERSYYKDMLTSGVNIIYLGAKVLSLVNSTYTRRFWPQFEYILANRAISERGFEPSFGRNTVRCIQSLEQVTAEQSRTLRAQWGEKTIAEAIEILGKPDVKVTNASDKTVLLGKLPDLEDELAGRLSDPNLPHVPVDCTPMCC
uniref:Heterokaryon incompatibility domain-containing protein n=1 Tax=Alexandrium monilatum TaxID=311494 RepID=A0A7S4VDW4_9DINO